MISSLLVADMKSFLKKHRTKIIACAVGGAMLLLWNSGRLFPSDDDLVKFVRSEVEEEKQKEEEEERKEEEEEKDTEEEDDDFEFLSRSLIDGDGHAAFCLELKRIRSKLTQFFDLESLRVKVQEADKLHHQNRFLFRRMLVTSSIARTIAAVYCVCVARTLMHCKLLLLRREHNLTQTSSSSFLGLEQDSNHFLSIHWADAICQVAQEGVDTAFKGLSDERLLKSSMDVQEVVGKVKQSVLVAAERKGWGTGLIRTPSPLERELGGGWLGRLLLADNRWRMKEGERGAGVCDLECWIVEEQVEQLNSNLALVTQLHPCSALPLHSHSSPLSSLYDLQCAPSPSSSLRSFAFLPPHCPRLSLSSFLLPVSFLLCSDSKPVR